MRKIFNLIICLSILAVVSCAIIPDDYIIGEYSYDENLDLKFIKYAYKVVNNPNGFRLEMIYKGHTFFDQTAYKTSIEARTQFEMKAREISNGKDIQFGVITTDNTRDFILGINTVLVIGDIKYK